MDPDSELAVTLSNGHRLMTYQFAALDRDLGTWTVAEPPRCVILGDAEALDISVEHTASDAPPDFDGAGIVDHVWSSAKNREKLKRQGETR